jgi:hypothetical protein
MRQLQSKRLHFLCNGVCVFFQIEQTPQINSSTHVRLLVLLTILDVVDGVMVTSTLRHVIEHGPSMYMMLACEVWHAAGMGWDGVGWHGMARDWIGLGWVGLRCCRRDRALGIGERCA